MAVIMHHHQPPTHVRSCRVASLRGEKRESSKVVCPLLALFFFYLKSMSVMRRGRRQGFFRRTWGVP